MYGKEGDERRKPRKGRRIRRKEENGKEGRKRTGRMEEWFKGRENFAIEIDSLIYIYTDEILSLHVQEVKSIAWHRLGISMSLFGHVW